MSEPGQGILGALLLIESAAVIGAVLTVGGLLAVFIAIIGALAGGYGLYAYLQD